MPPPRSDIFVFLLSTRAGGLGINLTAADTVSHHITAHICMYTCTCTCICLSTHVKVTWSHVLCMVAWPTWSHQSCPVCDDSILVGLIHVLQVIFYDSDWNPTVDQQVCRAEAHVMYMYTYMIWVAAGFSQLSKYIPKPCSVAP